MKLNLFRKSCVLSCTGMLFLLTACVTQPVSMSPQLIQQIERVETVLYIPQDNLKIDVVAGNPGASGLLGALVVSAIDSVRRSKAEENSKGLIVSLQNFQFRERMHAQLNAELDRVKAVQLLRPSQLQTTDTEALRLMAMQRSNASAVQFVKIEYALIDSALVMTAAVQMYPKSPRLMSFRTKPNSQNLLDEGNAILRKSFNYRSEAIATNVIQNSLNEGISNLAWQIALELDRLHSDSVMSKALRPTMLGTSQQNASSLPSSSAAISAVTPLPTSARMEAELIGAWRGKLDCGAYQGTAQIPNPQPWSVPVEMVIDAQGVMLKRGNNAYSETLSGKYLGGRSLSFSGQGQNIQPPSPPWLHEGSGSFELQNNQWVFKASSQLKSPLKNPNQTLRECKLELLKS